MDNGDFKVNVNAEVKADLQPVIENTPGALNKLFELLFGVKYAKQKRLMALIDLQKSKDIEKLEDGLAVFDIDKKRLDDISLENDSNKLEIITQVTTSEEVSNISDCVKEAVRHFINNDMDSDAELSKSFFNKWREEAKLFSEDYAQRLWGLVLAEEMQSPDTISCRILDILKNLTRTEAELFNRLSQYIIFDHGLVTGEHLTESDINVLVEAGLATFAGVYRSTKWPKTVVTYADKTTRTGHYLNSNAYLIFSDYDHKKDLSLTYIPLTQAGKTIYRIAKKHNNWDVKELIKAIFDQVKEFDNLITFPFVEIGKKNINTYEELIHKRASN